MGSQKRGWGGFPVQNYKEFLEISSSLPRQVCNEDSDNRFLGFVLWRDGDSHWILPDIDFAWLL